MAVKKKKLKVNSATGLHARSARIIVDTLEPFEASVFIENDNVRADARSILELMMLAAAPGTELEAQADGPQAEAALEELEDLFNEGFRENV